ncbi:hypothetical protein [Bacillus wiedmannii]|uniref:hypothetical protein n=1 Tax=Bacillus wiedmannii TaxID=1890302 RepID=UPI000BF1D930|nr:hypothetical protein [Bacillus wiedmannii]PEO40888.1 hypothetical protein CN555_02305 [Bacillus wiedmannii]
MERCKKHWHGRKNRWKEDSHQVLSKTAALNLNVLRKISLAIMKKWTPNTRKKVTSMRKKRVLLSRALHKFLPSILDM